MDKTIKRGVIAEKVAYRVIDLITREMFKKGDKLPSERDLSNMFSVGRPAVREALRALHMMNIVEIRHGDGTYVSSLEPTSLLNPFKIYMKLGKITVEQLFEARMILEAEIIILAAKRISEKQLEELDKLILQSRESMHNPRKFLETDVKLHGLICDAANNPLLKSIMMSLKELTVKSGEITASFEATRGIAHNDHVKIGEALKQKDEELCKKAMREHIMNIKKIAVTNKEIYKNKFLNLLKNM